MLTTHLNSLPYTKFILIQDSVRFKGEKVLEYLLKNHGKLDATYETHFCIFERDFNRHQAKFSTNKVKCHDFSSTSANDFKQFSRNVQGNCVLIVDSLAQLIYRYGTAETYQTLNEIMKNKNNVQQIVSVLHADLLQNREKTVQYFNHLATLSLELSENQRVSYVFKKSRRKVFNQIEQYRFENERFVTEPLPKPTAKQLIAQEIAPEDLSTFKIGLSERDRESREGLVLPYLPKDSEEKEPAGRITYKFDDIDDWDEEDPDDDLDI